MSTSFRVLNSLVVKNRRLVSLSFDADQKNNLRTEEEIERELNRTIFLLREERVKIQETSDFDLRVQNKIYPVKVKNTCIDCACK